MRDFSWLKAHIPGDAHCVLTNVTSAMGVISLMGPASRALLQSLTPANLSNEAFRFATSREIELGYGLVRASRITYVGELGWELYVPTDFTAGVYDEILAAGEAFDLVHAGYHALDSLRIEKAYRHWGHDITDQDSPLEAGLESTVKFDKPGGFIGREALLRQKESGIAKRMVQFRLRDPQPLLYGNEPIWLGDEIAGYVTSGELRPQPRSGRRPRLRPHVAVAGLPRTAQPLRDRGRGRPRPGRGLHPSHVRSCRQNAFAVETG